MPYGNRKRPSMADVGKRAEVSAQTVSRFFTGGYVSDETRARIETAVGELRYVPNRLPVQMKSSRTHTIGLLLLGPLNYGNAGLLSGLSRGAREFRQSLLTSQVESDPAESLEARDAVFRDIDNFLAVRVDGMVIATPYLGVDVLIEHVKGAIPVLALAERPESPAAPVGSDSYAAAREAVAHLLDLGHHRILHLSGPDNRTQSFTRRQAYLDELAARGVPPLPIIVSKEWDAASGAISGREVDPSTFTAVFAANDELALGFSSALNAYGLFAPRDYSIVGFDDMPEAQFFTPALTTVRIDFPRIGEAALMSILQLANGNQPENLQIETPLIVRESTAPPP